MGHPQIPGTSGGAPGIFAFSCDAYAEGETSEGQTRPPANVAIAICHSAAQPQRYRADLVACPRPLPQRRDMLLCSQGSCSFSFFLLWVFHNDPTTLYKPLPFRKMAWAGVLKGSCPSQNALRVNPWRAERMVLMRLRWRARGRRGGRALRKGARRGRQAQDQSVARGAPN